MQNETQTSYIAVPAAVRGPFNPVAYVLIDGHMLLPAIWQDSASKAPTTGDVVTVKLPCSRPTPQMLPLAAYLKEPESAPPGVVPPDDTVLEEVMAAEEAVPKDEAAPKDAAVSEPEPQEIAPQLESQEES